MSLSLPKCGIKGERMYAEFGHSCRHQERGDHSRVAGSPVLDNELGLPAHAEQHVGVVVAAGHLREVPADGMLLCEVKGRACHWRNLPCRHLCLIQGCVVVPAWQNPLLALCPFI